MSPSPASALRPDADSARRRVARSARRSGRGLLAALSLGFFATLGAGPVAAAPLDDLRLFVEAGQFEQAMSVAQQNRQLVGDVHFDFLYGVAAINVGRVPEGLLALERHLAAVPGNDRARLELARGYFLLGEYARARSEFEYVLRFNPPTPVRANIARFLDAMQLRDTTEPRGSARFYVEVGGGRDNNVNGGTHRKQVATAFGTAVTEGTPSFNVGDDQAVVAVGGQQTMRVTSRLSVFGGVDAEHRGNAQYDQYDTTSLTGQIGFTQLAGPALLRLALAGNVLQVGGSRYRDARSVAGEATFTPSSDWQLLLSTQFSEWKYQDEDAVRDARVTSLGGMATYSFGGPSAPQAGVRLTLTREDNQRLRRDLSRDGASLRLFGAVSPAAGWRLTAGLTGSQARHRGTDLGFGSVREDEGASVDLVLSWAVAAGWTLRAEYLASVVQSNHDIYDSRRQSLTLRTRYQY